MIIYIIPSIYILGTIFFLWLNNKTISEDQNNVFMRNFTVGLVSILWPISWWINLACWYSIRRSVRKAQNENIS